MPNFDQENTDPSLLPGRATTRALLAVGASLAAGASVAATAATAAAGTPPTPLGVAAHKPARRTAAPVPSPELLVAGDRGRAVSQLQRALHRHATGYFGSGTQRALIGFQRHHRLAADGVVGPRTRRALHLRVRIIPGQPTASAVPSSSTPSGSSVATTTAGSSGGYAIPSSIVQCESGGNWHAVNPSSGAGGAYQILPSTWAAYGGTGSPQDAPPAEQSAIAAKIWASSGPGAWSC